MSILANLLKKAETSQARTDIPPGLLQTVNAPAGRYGGRTKYLVLAGVAVGAVALGGLLALYLGLRPRVQPVIVPPQQMVSASQAPAVAVQRPISTAHPAVQQPVKPIEAGAQRAPAAPLPKKRSSRLCRNTLKTAQAAKQSAALAAPRAATSQESEKKAVVKDRSQIDPYLFAARNAEARRDYLGALKQYQKALEADPYNYKIMNNLASTMLQLGMPDEALQMANRALAIKPEYVSAMINAGIAQGRLGQMPAAKAMFAKAAAIDPANRGALYNLALTQERLGTLEDAANSYRRLANGGDPQGYLGLARLAEQRGNAAEAIKLYRELTALPDAGQRAKELARERLTALDR